MTLRILDLFSGIGGFSYAAEHLVGGFKTVQFVERELFCQQVLSKHWPDVPIHDDICSFEPERGSADVICGGFPCQDISTAGKQAGIKEGTRSGLFYELMRVVRMVEPRYVVLENVAAILGNGVDTVLGELAAAGFDAEWACIPASAVGACHQRDRWWLVAYPSTANRGTERAERCRTQRAECIQGWEENAGGFTEPHEVNAAYPATPGLQKPVQARLTTDAAEGGARLEPVAERGAFDVANPQGSGRRARQGSSAQSIGQQITGTGDHGPGSDAANANNQRQQEQQLASIAGGTGRVSWGDAPRRLNPDWRSYVSEPVLCRGDDGLSGRVDRLKALGNAVVPQVAAIPLMRVKALAQ